jgi:hypothetical protein
MAASNVTLEQVERLTDVLSPQEQLRLVAWIGERLSRSGLLETDEMRRRREYSAQVEAFLKLSEEMPAEAVSAVDSAEDIRRIREERSSYL